MPGPYLKPPEAAKLLTVSETTLRRMLENREIHGAFKLRGNWRIPKASLESQIKEAEETGKF